MSWERTLVVDSGLSAFHSQLHGGDGLQRDNRFQAIQVTLLRMDPITKTSEGNNQHRFNDSKAFPNTRSLTKREGNVSILRNRTQEARGIKGIRILPYLAT